MAKILVIDDSMITRNHLKKLLTAQGHEVSTASDGKDGLHQLLNNTYELIMLDQLMPGLEGLEVLRRIRAAGDETPVIVLTADLQSTTHASFQELGVCGVLGKPPETRELLETVSKHV